MPFRLSVNVNPLYEAIKIPVSGGPGGKERAGIWRCTGWWLDWWLNVTDAGARSTAERNISAHCPVICCTQSIHAAFYLSHSVICSWRPGGSADENKVWWTRICRCGIGGMEPVTVLHPELFIREQFQVGSENISVCIWLYFKFSLLHALYL